MTFYDWWAQQLKDPTKPIDPCMACEAAIRSEGLVVMKTILDIIDNPAQLKMTLAAAVAKREVPNVKLRDAQDV